MRTQFTTTTEARNTTSKAERSVKFDKTIAQLEPKAKKFAMKLCRSREEADDLFVEACVKLWENFDQVEKPLPYVYKAIMNLYCDKLRRIKTRNEFLDRFYKPGLSLLGSSNPIEYSPMVEILLGSLNEDDQAIITMVVDGYKGAEIAKEFTISLPTARYRISRIREHLIEQYIAIEEDRAVSIKHRTLKFNRTLPQFVQQ